MLGSLRAVPPNGNGAHYTYPAPTIIGNSTTTTNQQNIYPPADPIAPQYTITHDFTESIQKYTLRIMQGSDFNPELRPSDGPLDPSNIDRGPGQNQHK